MENRYADTDSNIEIREHDGAIGLTDRIKAAVTTIAPESQALTVAQLAPLGQFHTRGILATAELAGADRLEVFTRVLDVGCGTGGPARYLAATFGNNMTGVDLSPSFIDAATYPRARSRPIPSMIRLLPSTNTPIHSGPMSPPGWVLLLPIAAPKNPALTRTGAAENPIRTAHPIGADKPASYGPKTRSR